jgi:hypothetical protein
MKLPQTISVRYTEEEAEYLSVRPVVRQEFRLEELLDMLVSVAGKDVRRLQQILKSGTAIYHYYRYWWQGFEAEEAAVRAALERFPDADPARPFRAEDCTAVLLETESGPGRAPVELARDAASRKRWLRRASLWDVLMRLAAGEPPEYETYSYAKRGDLYRRETGGLPLEALSEEAERAAPRELRGQARALARARRIVFLCPRR